MKIFKCALEKIHHRTVLKNIKMFNEKVFEISKY